MKILELHPIHDKSKSFYGKARVVIHNGGDWVELWSYNTKVAEIEDGKVTVNGWFSVTTCRHINEFLRQHGLEPMTKAEMEKH